MVKNFGSNVPKNTFLLFNFLHLKWIPGDGRFVGTRKIGTDTTGF